MTDTCDQLPDISMIRVDYESAIFKEIDQILDTILQLVRKQQQNKMNDEMDLSCIEPVDSDDFLEDDSFEERVFESEDIYCCEDESSYNMIDFRNRV